MYYTLGINVADVTKLLINVSIQDEPMKSYVCGIVLPPPPPPLLLLLRTVSIRYDEALFLDVTTVTEG